MYPLVVKMEPDINFSYYLRFWIVQITIGFIPKEIIQFLIYPYLDGLSESV